MCQHDNVQRLRAASNACREKRGCDACRYRELRTRLKCTESPGHLLSPVMSRARLHSRCECQAGVRGIAVAVRGR
ncbi:hypothetical protein BSU04_12895 [Caballeronia sordidicola]|uniref:Uncharacterized protein n=1 Tax=Caballeronia sordidicola TaxID=196367 RepID=A0A226X424_CABSO|nr:hypothetical protein BSU04_12895 [Caballeronia sordidicola]